jgi:ABC-type bacteriocin/lantibiotic exporter with double-glycine peptidase domain
MVAPRQRQWMMAIQKRVGVTSDIFGVIRGVKMTGLSGKVQDQLQGLRDSELKESKRFRRVQIAHVLLSQFPTLITPALTFAAFAAFQSFRSGAALDVSTAFTTLSLLNLLINPVTGLLMIPPTFTSALQCFTRIQEFLNEEKRDDFRHFKLPSSDFNLAIQISRASFGWDEEKQPVLKDISLDISRGSLSVVVGPVASGKSTLLKSLAGETRRLKGSVVCLSPRLAYCDQEPWILNQTIRENILGGEEYDERFYERVVSACQLREDLDAMPLRDHVVVGSQGASVSGGQKHRIVSVFLKKKSTWLRGRTNLLLGACSSCV